MKSAALLTAASFLLASGLAASGVAAAQTSAPFGSAPPPPGINAPGVRQLPPTAPAPNVPAKDSAANQQLPAMQDSGTDQKHMDIPEVTTRQEEENEVQEYRRSGMLYRVVVTPKVGPQQVYDVDPDGTKHMEPGQPAVRPVMYKVLEWGKSKPAEASSSDAADGG